MSGTSQEKLEAFFCGANAQDGGTHPLDRERWYAFLMCSYENDDTDAVEEYLDEHIGEYAKLSLYGEKWKEAVLKSLVDQYSTTMNVLHIWTSRNK